MSSSQTLRELAFAKIGKSYGAVRALNDVSFSLRAGSVHALLGENGAGKSTLLKILSGAGWPFDGSVLFDGAPSSLRTSSSAFAGGIAVIHQELQLVPELSVAENLLLGHLPARKSWIDRSALHERASSILIELGLDIDPRTRTRQLSLGQRQMIEIGKALSRSAQVIAFDEPTSSLSSREVERLFALVRTLREQKKLILYVTHRMDEVFALCDSATVLRDGRHVKTFENLTGAANSTSVTGSRRVTSDELVRCMVGRELADVYGWSARKLGQRALAVDRLAGPGLSAPLSLSVAQGEIVGVFGLVGAGRSELLKLIFGAEHAHSGRIVVHGRELALRSPADAIEAGVLLCPEDRKREGIVPVRSVLDNINLSARRRHQSAGLFLDMRWERDNARTHIERLAIKTPSPEQRISHLSGGNQQKAILARWLSEHPRVLLLDEPTRGIDIGAKSEIYRIVFELAERGAGVLFVTSDLPEALGVCDRLLVMRQGRIAGELARRDFSEVAALQLALPIAENAA